MATYSTNLALTLIGTGEQSGTWGDTTNTNLGTLLEQSISGYVTQAITDGADTTITIPNGATGVARNMAIEMTGALTAARNLIVPANKKLYFIYNNTTGGYAVTVKVSGQTGVSVPNGKKVILVSNGTDIVEAVNTIVGAAAVGGALTVTGDTALNGSNITTTATTVTALAGATTLLTIGGTGASAVVAMPGTLDATNSTTGALKTAGGLAVAKAAFIGGALSVTGHTTFEGVTSTGATGSGKLVYDTTPTLSNPTVTNYVESVVAIGTVTSSNTIALTNGTVQTATLTASTACTFTMPTATAGKSFVLLLKQAASTGNGTATFTGVKWGTAGAPTITATAGKMDILTFISDGTNWYGSAAQGYTP